MRNPLKPVLEIRSKEGALHFKRWAIWQCSWFNIYIHYIAKSDADKHMHSHPWNFISIPFIGGYVSNNVGPWLISKKKCRRFVPIHMESTWFHKVRLLKPTWSLVFTGSRVNPDWGFLTGTGIIRFDEYRKRKNENAL